MLSLDEIRQKYPANAKLSDDKLVGKLYSTYGNGGDEVEFYKQFDVKPPVQTQKIWEDIKGIPGRAIDLGANIISEAPNAALALGEASQAYDHEPKRVAQNMAAGALEPLTEVRHIPNVLGEYAESRGLVKENPFPALERSDWTEWLKPDDENEYDKVFQSLGGLATGLKAGKMIGKALFPEISVAKNVPKMGALEKTAHTLKEAGKESLQYGTPFGVEALSQGEDPFAAALVPGLARTAFEGGIGAKNLASKHIAEPLKKQKSAAKETKAIEEKVTEKERQVKRHTEGEEALQGAEKKFKQEHEKAKSAFGQKVGEERAKAQETLELTGGRLEGERSAPRSESKAQVAKAVQEEHAKIKAEEAEHYKPFNKGGEAAETVVPEEHQAPSRVPKSIADTTTAPLLEKVGRKSDLWNAWEDTSLKAGELDQKLNKMYYEMKRKGWANVSDSEHAKYEAGTKKYKALTAREDALKKEWDKTKEPVAKDWHDVYKEARDEAYHIGRQMKSDAITSQELKTLKTKRDALKKIRDDAKNKLSTILSPEHYAKFEEANVHHQKYVAPFQKSPFLKALIENEGTVPFENFHSKASASKERALIDRLYKNQNVKSKVVAHDLKTLNLNSPEAVSEFLREHAKGLSNEIKTTLQERAEALIKENELAKLEAAMTKTEAKLLAQSPHIAKLLKNNPSLRKSFEQIGKEQKTLDLIREQMTKLGIDKDVIKREINAYKENMEDLKADADAWKKKKEKLDNMGKGAKKFAFHVGAYGAGLGAVAKLFGG
jgi:hypothetical protein